MNKLIIVIALFLFIPINVSADNIQEIYLTAQVQHRTAIPSTGVA